MRGLLLEPPMSKLAEKVARRYLDEDPEGDAWTVDEADRLVLRTNDMLITRPEKVLRKTIRGERDVGAAIRVGESIIFAPDLAEVLEDRLGVLINVRFRPALRGSPNTVSWEALTERAEVVSGKLVVHAALHGDTKLVSWIDLILDG